MKAVLTEDNVREIRAALAKGGQRGFKSRLAERFGVTPTAIHCIQERLSWRHV